jgi:tetratricopeptide (TPR) repeat protein
VEGLSRLRRFDALGAREHLEKAAALEQQHALTHSALGKAWSELGYDKKAKEAAGMAFELSRSLAREDRLLVEARFREATNEWDRAIELYRSLFEFFPDELEYGLSLASAQTRGGKANEALATVELLRRLPPAARVDPRIDLAEATASMSLSDYRRAQRAAATARGKANAHGAYILAARASLEEGWALEGLGEPERAMTAAEQARSILTEAGDRRGVAQAWNNTFSILWRQGNLEAAKKAADELLQTSRQIGYGEGVAQGLIDVAVVSTERGDLSVALSTLEEALAIEREIDDKPGVMILLNNIGAIYHLQGQLHRARLMYEEAFAIATDVGGKNMIATARNNIAELSEIQGDLDGAEHSYLEALRMRREMGVKREVAYVLGRLGEMYLARGDFAAARAHHEEALLIREELGANLEFTESRIALAEVSLEEGQVTDAESVIRDATREFSAQKAADRVAMAYELLGRVLLARDRPPEARAAIDRASARAGDGQNRLLRLEVAVTEARIRAAEGQQGASLQALESLLGETTEIGAVGIGLETRLALGEIEIAAGMAEEGRARLREVWKDAEAKGFRLISRKAARHLGA